MIARPTATVPVPDVVADIPEPLVEPRVYNWDESPQEAARYDRMYWNEDS